MSATLFELVARVRSDRRKRPSALTERPVRVYLLRGIARCSRCGRTLNCNSPKAGRRYRDTSKEKHDDCGATRKSLAAEVPEGQVAELFRKLCLPSDWRERVLSMVSQSEDEMDALRKKRVLQDRLHRLKDLYLDGDISKARYEADRARFTGEMQSLEAVAAPIHPLERSGTLLSDYAEAWDHAEDSERAEIVRAVLEEVYVDLDSGEVRYVKPRTPFLPIWQILAGEKLLLGDPERPRVDQAHLYPPVVALLGAGALYSLEPPGIDGDSKP